MDAVLKLLAVMSGDRRYEQILAPAEQKGEVTTMCSVAQRLEEQGMKKGIEKGRRDVHRNALNCWYPCAKPDISLLTLPRLKCTSPRRNFKNIWTGSFRSNNQQ